MIKRIEFEHAARQYLVETAIEPTHRVITLSVDGRIERRIPVGECESDEKIIALVDEVGAAENAQRIHRVTFRHKREDFVIEVWPVGRGYKSQVLLDRQIVSGPIAWNAVDVYSGPEELVDALKREIETGNIGRLVEKEYFPR